MDNFERIRRRFFMPRFFVARENIDIEAKSAVITGEDAHHIARSLRMAKGDNVTLCDGEGNDYLCRLDRIRDTESVCAVLGSTPSLSEPPYRALICQALVKGDRMDTAVKKTVEFGGTAVLPFESSRCIARMREERNSDNKIVRLRRISAEAAKQCGRGRLPQVFDSVSFDEMLRRASDTDLALFCYEDEHTEMLGTLLDGWKSRGMCPDTVSVVVGPEGGFSPEEAQEAGKAGLIPVSLGRRILRTESAAAFVLACLSVTFELH